jgi:RNA polymerase sigma-70 factor, ECF subfamily
MDQGARPAGSLSVGTDVGPASGTSSAMFFSPDRAETETETASGRSSEVRGFFSDPLFTLYNHAERRMPSPEEVTGLLNAASAGDPRAPEKLLELVYEDLRRLAAAYLQNEHNAQTLQATALVHEAYVRLVDWRNVSWESRAQFFAVAAQVMRRFLVDNARAKHALKRDAGQRLALEEAVSFPAVREVDLLALEESLTGLAKRDARQARIVELRFYGGLSIEETAHVLDVSASTVKEEWDFAKAWLKRQLKRS